MLNKKFSPIIGKFVGAWSSGNWGCLADPASSPKSPLDFDTQSPSPNPRGLRNYQLGGVGLGIVVEMEKLGNIILSNKPATGQSFEVDDLEEYTFVTRHCPNESYDETEQGLNELKNHRGSIFYVCPPIFEDFAHCIPYDFLKSCHLCNKKLHGKDIYMYRGEKGFCSNECRYKQIKMDERNHKYQGL